MFKTIRQWYRDEKEAYLYHCDYSIDYGPREYPTRRGLAAWLALDAAWVARFTVARWWCGIRGHRWRNVPRGDVIVAHRYCGRCGLHDFHTGG